MGKKQKHYPFLLVKIFSGLRGRSLASEAQETWKNSISFFFLVLMIMSLSQVFSANSHFFYMKTIYFETSQSEGKGMRGQRLQLCLSWALCWVWQLAGQYRFPVYYCFSPLTKHLVPGSCSRMQVPVDLLDVHLLLTLLAYDHNTGSCPVCSVSHPGRNVGNHFCTHTFPCTLVFLSTQGR